MNLDPSGNVSLSEMSNIIGFLGKTVQIGSINIAYVRSTGALLLNGIVQIRLHLIIRPLITELEQLAQTIASYDQGSAIKIRQQTESLRKLVSAKSTTFNILFPTAVAAIPGWKGTIGSIAVTSYRLAAVNSLASNAIREAAEAVNTSNEVYHYSFSGNIPARTIGLKTFFGYLDPASDVRTFNSGIKDLSQGNIISASFKLKEFKNQLGKKYKITGSGRFGSNKYGVHFSYHIDDTGTTFTRE